MTVLFTDLVGFTERSEELDPEDVRSLLTTYYTRVRSIAEEHGGTVDKFIGDAVLAVFGAPVAHEDDPERAVRAALAVCEWARTQNDVAVRAGVNTGTAFVALEPSETGIGIVAGDMVNTASRIQSAAPTGSVLVGEETYRATRDAFEYVEHEPIAAKGKSEPVRAWEPRAARVAIGESRRSGDAPLVGRVTELALLREALEGAVRTGVAQLVTVVGLPGIGKTRLVWELERVARALEPGTTWLRGRSLPYGAGTSFRGLAELIQSYAEIMESDAASDAEAKLARAIDSLTADRSDARWLVSQLRPLVGLAGETTGGEESRADSFAAWRRFFELLAEQGPLVLVLDDLHWADDGILDFLDDLARSSGLGPVLVVATARPELLERRPAWETDAANRVVVRLDPLSLDETSELIHALARRAEIDADVEAALLERAGGNPLYAEEFVRMVAEGQAPETALPLSVHGIVAARLDALAAEEKSLLQDAAVVGDVSWRGALRHVSGSGDRLDALMDALERREFVRTLPSSTIAGEREIAFRHPLIREVAYEQMPRARRAEKHRLAAEWVESLPADRAERRAEMLADHYLQALAYATAAAGDAGGDLRARAARALHDAGDHARALHSLDVAAARYEQALELAGSEAERAELGLALAETLLRTGDLDSAYRRLDDVIESARTGGHATLLARAALARGGVGVSVFDADEALVSLLEEALAALGDSSPALRARLLARLAIEVYYVPPPGYREQLSEEAVDLARKAGEPEALLDALNARRVTLWSPDHLEERLAVSRELVELAEAVGDRERSLLGRTWLVLDLVETGDLDEARAEIAAYARLVEPLGIPAYSWWAPAWGAMLAGLEGRFDDVRALAEDALEIGARAGDTNAAIYHQLACWTADMLQGRDYERWLPVIEAGIARGVSAFRCGLAMQLALAGKIDEARKAIADLGPERFGALLKDMNFYAGASQFSVAVGIVGDAEAAAEAYDVLRPYRGRVFTIARAAVCWGPADAYLGRLAATARRWESAEEHFGDAIRACERMGARAFAARTRWWHAEMLRARGRPEDAERALELETAARAEAEAMGLALTPPASG